MTDVPDACVALVVTSPPYFAGKAYEEEMGQGHIPADYVAYLEMLRDVFRECVRVLEPGGRIAVNVANLGRKPYRSLAADVTAILQDDLGLLLRGEIVWVKGKGATGSTAWGSFQSAANPVLRDLSERIVIASKGRFDRAVGRPERTRRGLPHENTISKEEFMEATLDVWHIAPESAERVGHPAPFPVDLPGRCIRLYTYIDDVVLDPFMGSGTTAVAAVQNGRRFLGVETDPSYVALAEQRIAAARDDIARHGLRPRPQPSDRPSSGARSEAPRAVASPGGRRQVHLLGERRLIVAFGGGIISILSPCVLPMVPGISERCHRLHDRRARRGRHRRGRRIVGMTALFTLGFGTVFTMSGSPPARSVRRRSTTRRRYTRVSGAIVMLMALYLAGSQLVMAPRLYPEKRIMVTRRFGWATAPVMGAAFGFGWSPCLGPILAAIIGVSSTQTSARAVGLLAAYSIGMGVSFLAVGLAFGASTSASVSCAATCGRSPSSRPRCCSPSACCCSWIGWSGSRVG